MTDNKKPTNARGWFRLMMAERRKHRFGSAEWQWRTEAACKYYWLIIGKPTAEWRK